MGHNFAGLGPRARELQLLKPECLEPTLHKKPTVRSSCAARE